MTADPERLLLYRSIDERLTKHGQHRRPEWWDAQAERGYLHPTAHRSIFQVGRGGDKSTMGRRFAETEMLSRWRIPGNERHYFAWVSENTDEAAQRPRQIESDLLALGIKCTRTGNTVDIDGSPVGFRSFACRIGAVSGFRCIGFVADEEAKWSSSDDGSNPAREVVASLRAMCVTHPDAREWHLSSPLGTLDYHFEQFAEGDNDIQIVANAPTWVANPSITELRTRQLERDERIWKREYAAIPQIGGANVFPIDMVDAAFARWRPLDRAQHNYIVLDPSSGGASSGDTFSFGVFGWANNEHERWFWDATINDFARSAWGEKIERGGYVATDPVLKFFEIDGVAGGFFGKVGGDEIVRRIARLATRFKTRNIISDQREQFFLDSALKRHGLQCKFYPWTATSKPKAVEVVRRWFADGLIALPNHDLMRRELLSFEEKITATGQLTYGARRGGHDDFVALLITAAHAELEADLKQSPIAPQYTYLNY